MPDHSILCADLIVRSNDADMGLKAETHKFEKPHVLNDRMYLKHKCDVLPESVMNSDGILTQVNDTIESIEQRQLIKKVSIQSIVKCMKFITKKWMKN